MSACLNCDASRVETLVDLGPQPPSNRFRRPAEPDADLHPLRFGQCAACGLLQLIGPMPSDMVKSRFSWLTYNEPEGHLDRAVDDLIARFSPSREARVGGLTYKDATTVERFKRRGFGRAESIPAGAILPDADAATGLESYQARITPQWARGFAAAHGRYDILLARHILEHAHAPAVFAAGLREMLTPEGLLVVELPDASKFMDSADYAFLWEEHVTYFTEATLRDFAARHGLSVRDARLYPYPFEDSLVAVFGAGGAPAASPAPTQDAFAAGRRFAARLVDERAWWRARLRALRKAGERTALFGAGHLTAKFVNFFDLADLIECVIDDNPHKQGLALPGSGLPVRPSAGLAESGITLCLMALSPESESKVVAARKDFTDAGGRFASIFARSALSYRLEAV